MQEIIKGLQTQIDELKARLDAFGSYDTIAYENFMATQTRYPRFLFGSVVWDIGSTSAGGSASNTVSVQGASVGDPVILGLNTAANSGRLFLAYVSAQDTVSLSYTNTTGVSVDPASDTFYVVVVKKPI